MEKEKTNGMGINRKKMYKKIENKRRDIYRQKIYKKEKYIISQYKKNAYGDFIYLEYLAQ